MNLPKKINKKELIENNLSSLDIFKHYIGNFKVGKVFSSPLRTDKNPSSCVFLGNNGLYMYKDYAEGTCLTPISYVATLYGLDYMNALDKICADFGLLKIDFQADIVKSNYKKIEVVEKSKTIIQFQPKQFTSKDIDYWWSYGIDILKLHREYNIYSINKLWINKEKFIIKRDELAFSYFFPVSNSVKIYFPRRKKQSKWYSNTSNLADLQGYHQLKIKEQQIPLLILTSSMKEVLLLKMYDISAVALHGEGANYNPDLIRHLKKYCSQIVSLMDFDEAGFKAGQKLQELYRIYPIDKPDYLQCKDISDCYKSQGSETIKQFINEIKQKYDYTKL